MSKKIYLIVAHPNLNGSKANKALLDVAKRMPNVEIRDLYAEYPNGKVDKTREQEALLRNDVVVFQFPLYWYSTPSLLKEWQDTVYTYGWAFGSQGSQIKDKIFTVATTVGSPETSYIEDGVSLMDKILFPLYGGAKFCSMKGVAPFASFGLGRPSDEALKTMQDNYQGFLKNLGN